ncbi:MAG: Uma2 family endonuclease [Cyanobacteriota bacterium]|nr:Uma2 family endonuclease [Cyanobacteriota bacterium]
MSESTLVQPEIALPPTQAELPCDDGEPMETQRHKDQMDMLIDGLRPWLEERADGYVGGNMFVYFSLEQVRNRDFKGPDFFAVLDVPKGERLSWVLWEEGKGPDVVIELLSDSTARRDKNEKKRIYQNQLRVPEYFWFDPFNAEDWEGFSLQHGGYQSIPIDERGQRTSQALGLALVRWQGSYRGVEATWLRWATLTGELLPLSEEIIERERERAEQERERATKAESQLFSCALELLREGMSVERVAGLTGLSEKEVRDLNDRTETEAD